MNKGKKDKHGLILGVAIAFALVLSILVSGYYNLIKDVDTGTPSSDLVFSGKLLGSTPKVQTVPGDGGVPKSCQEKKAEIEKLFEEARICDQDSDCVVENKGMFCPFGCFQIHNTSYNIDEILKKVIEFQDEKCFLCEYKCMTPPDQSDLKCLENQCVDIRYKKR
ncbi:hypothetical protein KBC86_00045 [Candidatus Gracilibacteria bacterium]|nr:hypothetical protein [Candidatus Gracilibacteria bacterium]